MLTGNDCQVRQRVQSEVMTKWGIGDRFPPLLFGSGNWTKTLAQSPESGVHVTTRKVTAGSRALAFLYQQSHERS